MMETKEGMQGFQERWLKFSIIIIVSDGNGLEEGSHSANLKRSAFNLPNNHATSSACLNNRSIMENVWSVCRPKCVIERVSNF